MSTWFVERLSLPAWLLWILPRLIWCRFRQEHRVSRCYVLDSSAAGLFAARMLRWATGVGVEPLHFRLVDVRDETGLLISLRILYQDVAKVEAMVTDDPAFQEWIRHLSGRAKRLASYVSKGITTFMNLSTRGTLGRALFIIQVCAWTMRRSQFEGRAVLFLERRPWLNGIRRYAKECNVAVVPLWNLSSLRFLWVLNMLPLSVIDSLRRLSQAPWSMPRSHSPRRQSSEPRIAVDYYVHLNLSRPECHSDLFFWQQSSLPARHLIVLFNHVTHPLDEAKWKDLNQHGIAALALRPQATTVAEAPVFYYRGCPEVTSLCTFPQISTIRGLEAKWLRGQAVRYWDRRAFWTSLFDTEGIKIHVCWYKYDGMHCAIADALQDVGGVAVIYQRAYEGFPSAETTIDTDIVFGFASGGAQLEQRAESRISYYVTTGYLGDHRIPLLKEQARHVRAQLSQRGARRIVAFSDENSLEDPRWHTGHRFMQENYIFLLEKVLTESWFGLAIKPKTPRTLRRRLGPVAKLLDEAIATGRCVVYEEGNVQGVYPPAAAALAADVAIHSHFHAATAGLESALAGVPTLLLDREGWPISPLYRLGVGRVVFADWASLWEACLEHWKRPDGIPGFGDWSPMLDELDPFRDGRAAERMGTYLSWMLEGFRAGRDRDAVMADAAERYTALWGRDKVTQINGSAGVPPREPVCLEELHASTR